MTAGTSATAALEKQKDFLAALRQDYSKLGVRIRTLDHSVACANPYTTLRVHYPALRAGKATVTDLVELLLDHMLPFALSRSEIDAAQNKYSVVPAHEYNRIIIALQRKARNLFKRANRATNRNGEGGELLLYLLTEWILQAPQLLAKMQMKTNPNMPVHGSDGIHVKFCEKTGRLMFIWGEAKLYSNPSAAIEAAAESIADALSEAKLNHEFALINRNISLTGLSSEASAALLSYLDPLEENSNKRVNATTCLIGFDFDGYAKLIGVEIDKAEEAFCSEVTKRLPEISKKLSASMATHGLQNEIIEVFFFPVPSVHELRNLFQDEIGWSN